MNTEDTDITKYFSGSIETMKDYSTIRFWSFFLENLILTKEYDEATAPKSFNDMLYNFNVSNLKTHSINNDQIKDKYPKSYKLSIDRLREEIDEASMECSAARIET